MRIGEVFRRPRKAVAAARQHDVEHDDVVPRHRRGGQRLVAGARRVHRHAQLLQAAVEAGGQLGVVLDQQEPHRGQA